MTPLSRKPDGRERSAAVIAVPMLYREFLPRTLRWLRLFGVSPRHREDVAQDAWIRVLRTIEEYDGARPFAPWLMTITFRAACDHLKRADVRRERLSESGEVEAQAPFAMEDERIDATRTLERLLPLLSVEHQQVLIMVDLEEQSPSDVAEALDVPLNTVYSRLARAREELQVVLRRFCAAEKRRLGAAVLPAFLLDSRTLFETGRDIPPLSAGTESRIWDGVQRRLEALDGSSDAATDPPTHTLPHSVAPPSTASPTGTSLLSVARLPWRSPVGLAVTVIASGLGGAWLTHWWMRGQPGRPEVIVQEQPRSVALAAPAVSAEPVSTAQATIVGVPLDAGPPVDSGVPIYDSREELSTLDAAYALYAERKCAAARARLGNRTGRAHAKDYSELRAKIDACLARDGGAP